MVILAGSAGALPAADGAARSQVAADASQFLEAYNRLYQSLYTVAQEAEWQASTDVTDEHTGQRIGADQAQAAFVGSTWVITPQVTKSITAPIPSGISNTQAIGLVLYTKYIHYFQLAGMVLLVAMVGAIVLTLRHKANVKRQDISAQNARTKATAMRVVKVASGQGLGDVPPREAAE